MFRYGNFFLSLEIVQRDGRTFDDMFHRIFIRLLAFQKIVHRTVQADPASIQSRTRPDIHQPVCSVHGLGIMLYDHDGVALVSEFLEGMDELAVIFLVQTDTRFVQDVEDVYQLGADLGGQTDSLALSTGEGCCRPVQ